MKKYFLLILLSLLFYQLTDAQFVIDNYPIDQFKLPDIDRQSLEFAANLLGDFNTRSNGSSNQSLTTSQFSPQVSLFYNRYINRENLQAFYAASTSPDLHMQNSGNEFSDVSNKSTSLRPDIHFTGERLSYRGSNFTRLGVEADINYIQDYETNTEAGLESKFRSHDLDTYLEIPVGFGTGRLEVVSDMAMALFLLNDAMYAGIDPFTISPDQVNAFASKMVTLRNERVFDTRVKRIHELRELYNFMKENNWTIAEDPGFFTILTDNWLYNTNVNRLAGRRWSYAFVPSYQYSAGKSKVNEADPITSNINTFGGVISVEFAKYKPVNVHRDIIRIHTVHVGATHEIFHSVFGESITDNLEAGILSSIGRQWIPNSRTVVNASFLVDYTYTHPFINKFQNPRDNHEINLSLNGITNYFISYRTRLFANFVMSYNYNRTGDHILLQTNPFEIAEINNGFHVRLNGGVTVSIF